MSKELKNCPFCQCKVAGDMRFFLHPKNDCIFSEWQFDELNVGKKWNRRAPCLVKTDELTETEIDLHLDNILRASGSGLRNYSMAKPLAEMRSAMRAAIEQAVRGKE